MSVPIIGQHNQGAPNAPGLTINCDIHDSEIIEIEKVVEIINTKTRDRQRISYDALQREITERFQDIGLIVSIGWWQAGTADGAVIPGMLIPEITIRDRTERKDFDHDKKVHEITNDILELGDKGVIKADPSKFESHEGHKH